MKSKTYTTDFRGPFYQTGDALVSLREAAAKSGDTKLQEKITKMQSDLIGIQADLDKNYIWD